MKQIKEIIKNNKIELIFLVIVILLFSVLICDFDKEKIKKNEKEEIKQEENQEKKNINVKTEQSNIKIDIKGAVNNPGVYEMEKNGRVIDAVNKAGGLKKNADTSMINLSKKLEDEMVITIYTASEMKKTQSICSPCECPEVNNACITENEAKVNSDDKKSNSQTNKKVSINTATLEELQTLEGIGQAKAKAIIGYRNTNGKFKKIEEIKNVSGIGESIFEKIKNNITI